MSERWREKTESEIELELIRQLGWSSEKVREARVHASQLGYISLCGYMQDILAGKSRALESQAPRRPIRAAHVPRTSAPPPIRPLEEILEEISRRFEVVLLPLEDLDIIKAFYSSPLGHLIMVNKRGEVYLWRISTTMGWGTRVDLSGLR